MGSAVLEAPEESLAQETEWQPREPAPAGMLHRARVAEDEGGGYAADSDLESVYKPRRESMSYRLRFGMPGTTAGKIVAGAGAFVVLGAITAAILGVRSMLLHDDRFVVATSSEIQIAGNEHLTRAQILSVFGSDLERNIFKVPLEERRADLERLPWVAHATVMRLLPNRIRVAVTERVPVAFVRQGTQIGLVDAEGVLLDMPEQSVGDPHYSFPVLTGLSAGDPLSTRAARMEVYRRFMLDMDSEGVKNSQLLSEVDVSNPEDVKALIPSGSTDILVHFGDEDFLARYKLYEQNLPVWKAQYPKLASVDTRYEHQMVLEMQPGTTVPVSGGELASQPDSKLAGQPVSESAGAAAAPADAAKSAPAAGKMDAKAKPAVVKASGKADLSKQKTAAALAAARKSVAANLQGGAATQPSGGQAKQ